MKQKLFSLTLALLAVMTLALPVSADVIWTPDDSFYEKHWDECDYVGRSYQLAGFDGKVAVYTAPGGMHKTTLDNGLQGTIQFTWTGYGLTWGYLCWITDHDTSGWVPMDDLSLIYDSQQFMADHAKEIEAVTPVPVNFQEAVLYSYPNGPVLEGTLQEDLDYQPISEVFTQIYTGTDGLRWGYVGYYMGHRNTWVCLDDPTNRALDSGIVSVSPSPAQARGSATSVTAGPPALLIAAVLVAAIVAVTAVLILRLKKREGQ